MQSIARVLCRKSVKHTFNSLCVRNGAALPCGTGLKYSTEALSVPKPGELRAYPPKITSIVDDISKLTLIEVADLNELLKRTLKISDAPMMAMGAAAAPAAAAEEEEEVQEVKKALFTVTLTSFDAGKKVALIKTVKSLMEGFNLVQAKKFVESTPQLVKAEMSEEDAKALKDQIEANGGKAEMK